MAYEPFSLSTRKTKSTLLVFSVLAYAISFFDVSLKNIPGVGFEIPVPVGALNFVVGTAVAYLTLAFALYCYDDITYMSRPENFQKESQELIEQNRKLTERMRELDKALSVGRSRSQGRSTSTSASASGDSSNSQTSTEGFSRSITSGASETYSRGSSESESWSKGYSETESKSVSQSVSRSDRLTELEELKKTVDENNDRLQAIRITRATWVRIYIFDTTLPLLLGLTSNVFLWLPLF